MGKSKLNKVDRLANNIQIMVKSQTPGLLCINPSNEKAFQLAVQQLGMKLDEFNIENDGFYLEIRLKRDIGKDSKIVPSLLKRPELPKNSTIKLQNNSE
ncbi:hypothetical protein [Synechocystis sp. PCC 7509]|uniref:hypothetical protein n=1 Tax=Synechocystis sp. PCC 7509 TaxID=927677 RepID=UPI0002ACD5B2|nr:hypothetical protein [Synechocystis sp. PCC 7509]